MIPKFAANKFYQNENINSNDFDAVNLYTSKVGSTYSTSTDGGGTILILLMRSRKMKELLWFQSILIKMVTHSLSIQVLKVKLLRLSLMTKSYILL
ncbi:MAG: hypothetical protein EGS53_06955 [Prevotella sp.]|nr:hypothetical protein [Prevotella sp.]